MKAQLIESEDEHHWVLLDHRVTQLVIDTRSLRLQTWSLDASAEVRLDAPFRLRPASGAERSLDPADPSTLIPALGLLRRGVRSLTVSRDRVLTLEFADGSALIAEPSATTAGWEVHGGGALEGLSYRAAIADPPAR